MKLIHCNINIEVNLLPQMVKSTNGRSISSNYHHVFSFRLAETMNETHIRVQSNACVHTCYYRWQTVQNDMVHVFCVNFNLPFQRHYTVRFFSVCLIRIRSNIKAPHILIINHCMCIIMNCEMHFPS